MNKRYEELDSLRGVAALFVVFSHMYQVIPPRKLSKIIFEFSPLRLFISGGEAVILFFILSGFVLALPYFNNNQSSYTSFIIKRICRIYMPYLVAMFIAIGCREIYYEGRMKGLSGWVNSFWTAPLSFQAVKDHVLMLGTFLSNLNPVIWSLVHEMRISIIFPLIMLLIVKLDWKKSLSLSVLCTLVAMILFEIFQPKNTGVEYVASLNYTAMFIIGALIAKHRTFIASKYNLLNKKMKLLIFASGLVTYLLIHPSFAIKAFVYQGISPFYRTVIDSWAITLGAAILIIFAINSALFSKILRTKFVCFLGKISYSLYLIHVVIILTMLQTLHSTGVPIRIILIGSLLVSFLFATLMYNFIEKPSIKLGKYLTTTRLKQNKSVESEKVSSKFA